MAGGRRPRPSRTKGGARRFCPRLELLEDPLDPAVFNVARGGSLAAAIAVADTNSDNNNTIVLAPGA
jgi:hypothetical protein